MGGVGWRVEESHEQGCSEGVISEDGVAVVVRVTRDLIRDELFDQVDLRLVVYSEEN